MKVIKEGVPGGLWHPQVTCTGAGNGNHGCGAILELEESDLFHTQHTDYGGDTEHYITIECPCCSRWTDIQKTVDIPYGIRSAVMAQKPRSSHN